MIKMGFIYNYIFGFITNFCINVVKCGPIPKHVAIIMDGNRRFAKRYGLETKEGHRTGKETAMKIVEWCSQLGIKEVTLYAFSIENFKRSEEEVNQLMNLADEFFQNYINKRTEEKYKRGSIRILGDYSYANKKIQRLAAQLEMTNPHNPEITANICFAYTSTNEITNALQELQECVQKGLILESDINEELISKFLYSSHSTEPGLVLRTSGEIRLSDFLLWQSSYSVIYFTEVLWPLFSIWNFLWAILYYQRNFNPVVEGKRLRDIRRNVSEKTYLENIEKHSDMRERLKNCVSHLENKRRQFLSLIYNENSVKSN